MSIKQTIDTPIQVDPNKRASVVNEANDGLKAVPVELVTKALDDSTFKQVNGNNGLPVYITGSANSGGFKEYRGLSSDIKPDGETIGDTFFEIDTKAVYMWDGTDWKVI